MRTKMESSAEDYVGLTRLMSLVLKGRSAIIEILSRRKSIDQDTVNYSGCGRRKALFESHISAAWLASEAGHSDILKALLALGADANAMAVTKEGVSLSCLQVAAANGKLDTVNILLGAGALVKCGKSCLLEPARQGRDDIIKVLLEAGADPNMPGANWLFLAQKMVIKQQLLFCSHLEPS